MKTKKFKAIKTSEKITKEQFLALAARDKRKHTSHYKRVPVESCSWATAPKPEYVMVDGIPHKSVNGVLVPLTKKA